MRHTVYIWMGAALLALGVVLGCGDAPGEREFANALRQLERGQWERARDLFEKSINKRPGREENARAYAFMGWLEWKLGHEEAALQAFRDSLRLDPHRWEPLYNMGVLMHERGESARAVELLRRAHEQAPDETMPLEYLARVHIENRNWREARTALFEARALSPRSPRILTALALVELERDGPPAAFPYLMQAFESVSDYPPALYNLAVLYERQPGREQEAKSFYRQYLETGPDLPRARMAEQALARLRGELERPDDVAVEAPRPEPPEPAPVDPDVRMDEIIERARRLAAGNEPDLAVNLCIRAATEARLQGRSDLEERALRAAVELAPASARAHHAMGSFYLARGRTEEALEAYRRTVEQEEDWVPGLLALAEAAARAGEYDEAREALRRASETQPNNPDPLWALARFFDETLNLTNRALRAYREFREQFPGDPRAAQARDRVRRLEPDPVVAVDEEPTRPALPPDIEAERFRDVDSAVQAFNRGVTHQRRGDWDGAVRFYERAVTLDPAFVQAWYNLGLAYRTLGRREEARRALERAIDMQPDMLNARYNLALLYWDMRNRESAIEQARAVLEIDSDYALAHHLLGHIYAQEAATLEEARRHYTRFLALAPRDPAAPAIRQWLGP